MNLIKGKHNIKCNKCDKEFAEIIHYGGEEIINSCKYCDDKSSECPECYLITMENKKCCEWNGTKTKKGYGVININGKQFKVQRLAVLLSGRKIPKGMVTDHLCRNRSCINPEHLEVVSNVENVMRGESFSVKNKNKDRCIKGHLYSEHGRSTKRRGNKVWRSCYTCAYQPKNERKKTTT